MRPNTSRSTTTSASSGGQARHAPEDLVELLLVGVVEPPGLEPRALHEPERLARHGHDHVVPRLGAGAREGDQRPEVTGSASRGREDAH